VKVLRRGALSALPMLRKGKKGSRYVWRILQMLAGCALSSARDVQTVPVVVSLASYPLRIGGVYLTLLSILDQSTPPSTILLSLSSEQFAGRESSLPWRLKAVRALFPDRIELRWAESDTRSYKKFLPAMAEYEDQAVVTADDDVLYARTWLEDLWRAHTAWPGTVVGSRGFDIGQDAGGAIEPYADWTEPVRNQPSRRILLTGVGGILYPPYLLPPHALQPELFMKACPTADDIWLKCVALSQGVLALATAGEEKFIARPGTQRVGLWKLNRAGRMNDDQLKAAMAVLNLSPAQFRD
jgi:hypothetical protein